MTLYTRHQLLLVLVLTAAASAGLAIEHWRRARPELAERLEAFDRTERPEATPPSSRAPGRSSRAMPVAAPLDVNHASETELADLPGVGPALASRIVAARPFTNVEELGRVRGMRRGLLDRLRPLVAVGQ
jgi:DNA uptake protein ComE-like DNA-binding protein